MVRIVVMATGAHEYDDEMMISKRIWVCIWRWKWSGVRMIIRD